tara:strand:- start:455 stop:619 length:165 start_codon:yes stop_codon:yes gene_type:complete
MAKLVYSVGLIKGVKMPPHILLILAQIQESDPELYKEILKEIAQKIEDLKKESA